jgi:hypothetical protein
MLTLVAHMEIRDVTMRVFCVVRLAVGDCYVNVFCAVRL